jgi:hypothetical protein
MVSVRTLSILLSAAAAASAACSRQGLKSSMDDFLNSAIEKKSSLAVTSNSPARISQNNVLLKSVTETAWSNITGFYNSFRVNSIDTEACQMASLVLLNEKGPDGKDAPAIVSIRIKTAEDGKTRTQLEILNVLAGSHNFFAPQRFPNTAGEKWSTKTAGGLSRAELIKIANEYPSGIQAGNGVKVPTAASCPRMENGVKTAEICNANLERFKQPVTNRRWVADTETGVVLGSFYFDKRERMKYEFGLFLNEYFKVDNGKLAGIEAAMKNLNGSFVDAWKDLA